MIKKISLLFSLIVLVLIYQNCGDIGIKTMDAPLVVREQVSAKGEICPVTGENISTPVNVIFVVDMSQSNFGGSSFGANEPNNPTCSWSRGDVNTPTDIPGLRFDLIKNLITSFQSRGTFRYSVIGFSDGAMFNSGTESCNSPLLNSAGALAAVESLRATQTHDLTVGLTTPNCNTSPFFMGNTSYWAALQCLDLKVKTNLSEGTPTKPIYHVYFITDGKPTDTDVVQGQYSGALTAMRNEIASDVAGFRVQPVYYHAGSQGDDQAEALAALNNMIAGVSPQFPAVTSNNLPLLEAQLREQFTSTAQMSYTIKNFSVINLTARNQNGILTSDDLMNGGLGGNIRQIISAQAGLDKDKDLIPDFLEVIRGLSTARKDALEDADSDGFSNLEELQRGSEIWISENQTSTPANYLTQSSLFELTGQYCENQQKKFGYAIQQIPLVPVQAYRDEAPDALDFSHAENENVIMIYYVAEPLNHQSSRVLFVQLLKRKVGQSGPIEQSELKEFIRYGVME